MQKTAEEEMPRGETADTDGDQVTDNQEVTEENMKKTKKEDEEEDREEKKTCQHWQETEDEEDYEDIWNDETGPRR